MEMNRAHVSDNYIMVQLSIQNFRHYEYVQNICRNDKRLSPFSCQPIGYLLSAYKALPKASSQSCLLTCGRKGKARCLNTMLFNVHSALLLRREKVADKLCLQIFCKRCSVNMNQLQSSGGNKESDTDQHWQAVLKNPYKSQTQQHQLWKVKLCSYCNIELSGNTSLISSHTQLHKVL